MVSEWELGRVVNLTESFDLPDFETLSASATLATPMHSFSRGMEIVISTRIPLWWYRGAKRAAGARKVIEVAAFIGAAALLSHLILQSRW
jgi:hypothetical protein